MPAYQRGGTSSPGINSYGGFQPGSDLSRSIHVYLSCVLLAAVSEMKFL
jgi:hypothetical protein